jgi:hypothetical protein
VRKNGQTAISKVPARAASRLLPPRASADPTPSNGTPAALRRRIARARGCAGNSRPGPAPRRRGRLAPGGAAVGRAGKPFTCMSSAIGLPSFTTGQRCASQAHRREERLAPRSVREHVNHARKLTRDSKGPVRNRFFTNRQYSEHRGGSIYVFHGVNARRGVLRRLTNRFMPAVAVPRPRATTK